MENVTTLGEFIIERQHDFPGSTGEFTRILDAIRLSAKIVNQKVNKAGLMNHLMGAAGSANIQGEEQQKLDVYANYQFIKSLSLRGVLCGIASEENENFISLNDSANYIIAIDPLDGSSNIDVNVSVGTIFSIYHRITTPGTPVTLEDFLQPGTAQAASGYVIYGSSTMLVYTTGKGVNGFTFDPGIGVFFLSHPDIKIPAAGKIYSVNEGNLATCPKGVQNFVRYAQETDKASNRPYTGRYIGSLVADFHRNLIKGGVYLYPSTAASPNGKLRILYECNPMAFIAEQAGGKASDGNQRVLEIKPTSLHQRCPIYIGSKDMVAKIESLLKG